jgi:hypothetical protein
METDMTFAAIITILFRIGLFGWHIICRNASKRRYRKVPEPHQGNDQMLSSDFLKLTILAAIIVIPAACGQ